MAKSELCVPVLALSAEEQWMADAMMMMHTMAGMLNVSKRRFLGDESGRHGIELDDAHARRIAAQLEALVATAPKQYG